MKRLLFAAGLALLLHGLLLSTEAQWVKKREISEYKPRHLSIRLSYLKSRIVATVATQVEAKPENIVKPPKSSPKKQIRDPVKSILPKIIEKSVQYRITKPLKKRQSLPQKAIHKAVEPVETIKPQLPPEPDFSEFEFHPGRQKPEITEDDLHFSAVSTEQRDSKAIPPISPIPLIEAIPLYRINPPPKYPNPARRRGYQGTVVMEVLVNREGKVEELRLFQSSGYPVLDGAAMKSVKNWEFEPGRRGDEAVEMWVRVPIRFQLK